MKLLFDESLSFRLVAALADIYPDSRHVREAGLSGSDDLCVWNYAAEHGFLLASKDTDFYERSLVFGAPPKKFGYESETAQSAKQLRYCAASTSLFVISLKTQRPPFYH